MGMNYSPADLYLSDKKFAKNGTALRDLDVKWAKQGTQVITENQIKMKKEYPELSFLCEHFKKLYKKYCNHKSAEDIFRTVESTIKTMEEQLDENPQIRHNRQINGQYPENMSIADVTTAWFFGELDPEHHNKANDRIFCKYMTNKIVQ